MPPGPHYKVLVLSSILRTRFRPDGVDVLEDTSGKNIVPAADRAYRDRDILPLVSNAAGGPVVIEMRMGDPIPQILNLSAESAVPLAERQRSKGLIPILLLAPGVHGNQISRTQSVHAAPAHYQGEVQCPVGVDGIAVSIDERHDWKHGLEMVAGIRSGYPLGKAHIRAAGGTDAAVAPGLFQKPLLRIGAVAAFICKRFPLALGASLAPAVLADNHISAPGVEPSITVLFIALAVRRTNEYHWILALGFRQKYIR